MSKKKAVIKKKRDCFEAAREALGELEDIQFWCNEEGGDGYVHFAEDLMSNIADLRETIDRHEP